MSETGVKSSHSIILQSRVPRRAAGAAVVSVVALVALALPASAHVTVSSSDATAGSYAKAVFRVPSESETANTVKLSVTLPTAHPFAHVSPQVHSGWKVALTRTTLPAPVKVGTFTLSKAVTKVTWTATGKGVPAGQFDEFAVSLGTMPNDVAALTLPTVQTYSDGKVVRWDESTPASGVEPEHPAPRLRVAAADQSRAATQDAAAGTPTTEPDLQDGSDTTARILGGLGLALGGAAVALVGLRRRSGRP